MSQIEPRTGTQIFLESLAILFFGNLFACNLGQLLVVLRLAGLSGASVRPCQGLVGVRQ